MRSKKLYIVLISIMIVFFLIIFLIFGTQNVLQENYKATIIVGDSTVWQYQKKKWVYLSSTNSLEKLDWKKYEVYVDNQKFGDYYLWRDDHWYLFDSNRNAISYEGRLLAYFANYDLKVIPFQEDKNIEENYANQVLVERGIEPNQNYTSSSHIAFDFDSDGIDEDFYLITNAFDMESSEKVHFSLVYMVKNQELFMLYDSVTNGSSYNICKPFFNSILDVNHDQIYEIILSCGRYSAEEQLDMLYQYVDGDFKIVISNQ